MHKKLTTSVARLVRLGFAAILVAAGFGATAGEAPVCGPIPAAGGALEPATAPCFTCLPLGRPAQPSLLSGERFAGGLRAYVDPQTGALAAPSPAGAGVQELPPALRQAFSTSDEGLVEVVLPNGVVKVALQGRFMSATFATIGEDGEVRLGHGVTPTVPPQETADETRKGSAEDDQP